MVAVSGYEFGYEFFLNETQMQRKLFYRYYTLIFHILVKLGSFLAIVKICSQNFVIMSAGEKLEVFPMQFHMLVLTQTKQKNA